jgi:hypothetical protein
MLSTEPCPEATAFAQNALNLALHHLAEPVHQDRDDNMLPRAICLYAVKCTLMSGKVIGQCLLQGCRFGGDLSPEREGTVDLSRCTDVASMLRTLVVCNDDASLHVQLGSLIAKGNRSGFEFQCSHAKVYLHVIGSDCADNPRTLFDSSGSLNLPDEPAEFAGLRFKLGCLRCVCGCQCCHRLLASFIKQPLCACRPFGTRVDALANAVKVRLCVQRALSVVGGDMTRLSRKHMENVMWDMQHKGELDPPKKQSGRKRARDQDGVYSSCVICLGSVCN